MRTLRTSMQHSSLTLLQAGRLVRWRHSRTLSGLPLRVCATRACGRGSQ